MKTNQDEPQKIVLQLTELLGATYKVFQPTKKFPPGGKADWMIQSADLEKAHNTFHFDSLWKEDQQIIVETRDVASIEEWVLWDYGESGHARLHGMDLTDFGNPEVKKTLLERFPKLEVRVSRFESALALLSSEHRIPLRIRYDGGKGIAILYLQAVLSAGDSSHEADEIRRGEAVLRAAGKEVGKLQASPRLD